MPGFIKPQLATLKSKAPSGEQWLHEIKYDGYRVQLHLNQGKRKVYTRTGPDWIKRFSLIAGAFDILGQAIIDGERRTDIDRRIGLGLKSANNGSQLISRSLRQCILPCPSIPER